MSRRFRKSCQKCKALQVLSSVVTNVDVDLNEYQKEPEFIADGECKEAVEAVKRSRTQAYASTRLAACPDHISTGFRRIQRRRDYITCWLDSLTRPPMLNACLLIRRESASRFMFLWVNSLDKSLLHVVTRHLDGIHASSRMISRIL